MGSRSPHYIVYRCTFPGCSETFRWPAALGGDNAKMLADRDTWLCQDHRRARVSPDLPAHTTTLVVSELLPGFVGKVGPMRFVLPNSEDVGHVRVSGEGWYAVAADFPPGTRLEMTVRVVLPDAGGDV